MTDEEKRVRAIRGAIAEFAKKERSKVVSLDVFFTDHGLTVGVKGGFVPAHMGFIRAFGEPAYLEIVEILKDAGYRISEALKRTGQVEAAITVDADAARAQAKEAEAKP